jgi:hypothetical protein
MRGMEHAAEMRLHPVDFSECAFRRDSVEEEFHHARSLGLSVALGGAMGAAIGAATGHVGVWVGVGLAAYIALSVAARFSLRSDSEKQSRSN